MLALAGPMASTSFRLVFPPLARFVLRRRSSSLASASVIILMLGCPTRSWGLYRLSFVIMKGEAKTFVGWQLPTFGW